LADRLQAGEWGVARESGGFAGAGVVVRALMEYGNKTQEQVREFLEAKLAKLIAATPKGQKPPTRAALYQSFRKHPQIGEIIARLEKEKADKQSPVVNVEEELEALKAA
jgi:hypothetical protein